MINHNRGFWGILSNVLPKTELGDLVYSWAKFVRVHRRLPKRNRKLFNDMLYGSKQSLEIMKPLRTYTTDKEFFKKMVRGEVGAHNVVPTLAVFHTEADVDAFDFTRFDTAVSADGDMVLVYVTNDERANAKKKVNLHLNSSIVEEKSYQDYK